MSNDGLVYLLDLAGSTLSQANQRVAVLTAENQALRAQLAEQETPT